MLFNVRIASSKYKKPPLLLTRALLFGGPGRNRTGLRMSDPAVQALPISLSFVECDLLSLLVSNAQ
jgi:hypothetical protein